MFKNRFKRYVGLISSISLLIGFVIFVAIANSYLDSNILQRDDVASTRTAVNARVLERVGTIDDELRSETYDTHWVHRRQFYLSHATLRDSGF